MFLKDLIGKKVLSHDGKILGYTRCALFSAGFKRITALLCADEEEEDFFLPLSPKQPIDDALVMPRRKSAKITGMPYSPLLRQAYSAQGKFLGRVTDVRLEYLSVAALLIDGTDSPAGRVKPLGACILIDTAERAARPRRAKNSAAAENKARPAVLLGRTLRHDIREDTDELLFARGTRITPAVLRTAARHKKLVELTAKTLAD